MIFFFFFFSLVFLTSLSLFVFFFNFCLVLFGQPKRKTRVEKTLIENYRFCSPVALSLSALENIIKSHRKAE